MPMCDPDETLPSAKTAALVVTYFPDAEFSERLERLLEQVARLVIVDNGSPEAALGWAGGLAGRDGVTIQRNGANLGIAAALNQGLSLLSGEGYDWVITLDQDSTVAPGCISKSPRHRRQGRGPRRHRAGRLQPARRRNRRRRTSLGAPEAGVSVLRTGGLRPDRTRRRHARHHLRNAHQPRGVPPARAVPGGLLHRFRRIPSTASGRGRRATGFWSAAGRGSCTGSVRSSRPSCWA